MREESERMVRDVWEAGEGYESFIGRWSRLVAEEFLRWLSGPAAASWLDVGCGTGILTQTIVDLAAPATVRGIDQSEGFISYAKKSLPHSRAGFDVGSAGSLPSGPGTYDVVVSGLLLNFLPDCDLALAEMKRVTRSGGIVGAYVWDYAGKMEVLRVFWDSAVRLDPQAALLDEGKRFPLCNPVSLQKLFIERGLDCVETRPIDITAHFVDFQDYWSPFLSGQGPAPSYVATVGREQQDELREHVRASLPIAADGSIDLVARAWAVKGRS